jgi:hypothetical protein
MLKSSLQKLFGRHHRLLPQIYATGRKHMPVIFSFLVGFVLLDL